MVPCLLRLLCSCLALALTALQPALAAVSLQVVSDVRTEAAPGATVALPDRHEVLNVTLGDDVMVVARPGAQVVYDFRQRRYYALDTVHKVYVDYSLYSIVGFRTMELEHRASMDAMLTAAKVVAPAVRAVDREQELSIAASHHATSDAAADTTFDETTEGDLRAFASGGARLATWSTRGSTVAAADAAHFARFLRYTQAGHPHLLALLATGALIPQQLTFTVNTMAGVRTVQLNVSAVRQVEAPVVDLTGYARRSNATDPLDALLDRMAAQTPAQLAALRAAHPCDTAADYRDHQLLDTMLGRTECVLATGAAMLPFTPAQTEQLRADGGVVLMFAAIGPKSRGEYAASITTLAALRGQAPRKAYLLQLFEANNRRVLGQHRESLQLFEAVLTANPVLAGAYKDLGDLLLTQFDSTRAWRSWDIGRAIGPQVANFDAVGKLEQELAARHPEFF
jgi:hypothetical protein